MRRKQLWQFMLAAVLEVAAVHSYSIGMDGVKGGTTKDLIFESLGDNDVSGSAAGGWTFRSATATPSDVKDASYSSGSAGTFTKSGKTFNFVSFTINLSGKITTSGDKSGPYKYSISAKRQDPDFEIDPTQAVIPAGDSFTFYAKEKMTVNGSVVYGAKNSDWTITDAAGHTSDKISSTSSINIGSSWLDFFNLYYDTPTPTPGIYTITATTTSSSEPQSKTAQLTVVGVASVTGTPTGGTAVTSTTNGTDANGNAETIPTVYVEVNTALTAKATPYPGSAWPADNPVWSSSGSWIFSSHILGTSTGVDTVSIDTSGTDDSFTVTASCGTSNKSIKVKTFNYIFALYTDDPTSGDAPFAVSSSGIEPGHTWWKLYITNNVTAGNVNLTAYSTYINTPVGYYPSSAVDPATDFSSPGMLTINDTAHSASKTKDQIVTRSNFISGLNYTQGINNSPGTYVAARRVTITVTPDATNLPLGTYCTSKTEKNCTTVALGAASASGATPPDADQTYSGSWYFGTLAIEYEGHNPSKLASNM